MYGRHRYGIVRTIADVLSSIPRARADLFNSTFNKNLQDLLMLVYMSNLTRTHVEIANKLKIGRL